MMLASIAALKFSSSATDTSHQQSVDNDDEMVENSNNINTISNVVRNSNNDKCTNNNPCHSNMQGDNDFAIGSLNELDHVHGRKMAKY